MIAILASFIVVFALILMAVSVGLKFFDARRKSQMVNMLQTAAGETVVAITNLLKEIEPENQGGLKQLVSSLHFAHHARVQIMQAGMAWSPMRLIGTMAGMAMVGFMGGFLLPAAVAGFLASVVLAIVM